MREIVHIQAGQCGNQIGAKVSFRFSLTFVVLGYFSIDGRKRPVVLVIFFDHFRATPPFSFVSAFFLSFFILAKRKMRKGSFFREWIAFTPHPLFLSASSNGSCKYFMFSY